MRFRATVIVGNRKGKVGLGLGKANEVQAAVQKAIKDARRHMVRVPLTKGTIPHEVEVKFKAAKIRLIPAMEGTGVIAGGSLRVVLEHAGVKNVLSKRFGSGNKLVNAQASMLALQKLSMHRKNGSTEGLPVEDVDVEKKAADVALLKDHPQVREVTKQEVKQQQEISRQASVGE